MSLNSERLKQIPNDGIIFADIYDDPITSTGFKECISRLSVNFGVNYAAEFPAKLTLLLEEMIFSGWTNERMKQATRYFIQNNRFPTWTVADWFNLPLQKLYPYSKYLSEIHEKGKSFNLEITWHQFGDVSLWGYKTK